MLQLWVQARQSTTNAMNDTRKIEFMSFGAFKKWYQEHPCPHHDAKAEEMWLALKHDTATVPRRIDEYGQLLLGIRVAS